MDQINWNNFNGDDFTLFCNALLSFELGKAFKPYAAPGQDGGIDGLFDGTYLNRTGKWRFQYKYRSGARSQNYSNLKSIVKTELDTLNDESFYVLLTNVELLPQELKELQQLLTDEAARLNKQCAIEVWDGAKLFNLYLSYPLLKLWMQDGFQTAQLVDYKMHFKKELATTGFLPGTLSNEFFCREEDLTELEGILSSDATMFVVNGEAGIGKTRLVLEFFKRSINSNVKWTAVSLLNRNVDFDKIRIALSGPDNFIVLIDDAHTFDPAIIADMLSISGQAVNKIKIILTVRNLEAYRSLSLLKEYQKADIPHINLNEISRPDTAKIFQLYASGHAHYSNFIDGLVEISYGKPILIVAMLNAIANGVPLASVRDKGFLRDYVTNYFSDYYNSVSKLNGWSILQVKRFLQNVVLIEPFNYTDSNVIEKLTSIQGLQPADGAAALKLLLENDLVDGRYLQSIKPDFYSDILLSEIDRNEVPNYIGDLIQFLDNIVINLSSVEESSPDNSGLLNDILTEYVSFIKGALKIEIIDRVLSTILTIAGYQPKIAAKAVQNYIDALSDESHVIYQEWSAYKDRPGASAFTALNKAVELLSYLSGLPEYYDFAFRKSLQLSTLTKDMKVVQLYAFGRKDVIEHFAFRRQHFFLNEFGKKLKRMKPQELNFGLQVIKSWLNLEFMVTGSSSANRFELNITNYFLPASASVKKLRKNIAELLIKVFNDPSAAVHRLDIVKDLLDIPRSILSTSKNAKPYSNNEEFKIVLNFLEKESSKFDLQEKKEIDDRLFWFKRWGIPAEFHPQLATIKQHLQPRNLTEQLVQIFSKAENSFNDLNHIEAKVSQACDALVAQFDTEAMAIGIIEYLESEKYGPPYFYVFLGRMIERYSGYAKTLYERMKVDAPRLFVNYGTDILAGAHYVFNDAAFYWAKVKELQKANTPETDNMLLSVYGRRVPGLTKIKDEDVAVILKVFNKKNKENNMNLASSIQSLIAADYDKIEEICVDFLTRAHQREAEMFFIWLSDNKVASDQLLTKLILEHTIKFYLTYELERCLNKVLRIQGQDIIFDYLTRRYEHKKAIVINQKTLMGYEFVPSDGDHSHLFDGLSDQRPAMFIKALDWYLSIDSEGGHLFYAKNMLEYLKPANSLDQHVYDRYKELIYNLDDKATGLDRLMDSLSIFHTKDDKLLDLVVEGVTAVNDLQDTDNEYYKLVRQESYFAVTTMGVKSAVANEPFQVDLDLQNLLQVKIAGMPNYLPATQFLKEVLKSVDADIDRSSDRDNLRW